MLWIWSKENRNWIMKRENNTGWNNLIKKLNFKSKIRYNIRTQIRQKMSTNSTKIWRQLLTAITEKRKRLRRMRVISKNALKTSLKMRLMTSMWGFKMCLKLRVWSISRVTLRLSMPTPIWMTFKGMSKTSPQRSLTQTGSIKIWCIYWRYIDRMLRFRPKRSNRNKNSWNKKVFRSTSTN